MDNLWAPWRIEFIRDNRYKEGGHPCVFCELATGEPNNKNLVLTRGKDNYIVMNRFPYAVGHLLIVPYGHTAKLKDFSGSAHQEILSLLAESMDILAEVLNADGFNCGLNVGRAAGCGILDHLHWHIVPRWNGDHNFLPVLGKTRIMPEYLSDTHDRLSDRFKKLNKK